MTLRQRVLVKSVSQYLWPKDDSEVKIRLSASLAMLVSGKLLNVSVPFMFKMIVDNLSQDLNAGALCGSLVLGYGAARAGASVFQELRTAVFSSVAQKVIRKVSCNFFEHVLRLDTQFHQSSQAGAISRIIDRGTKGISFLLGAVVFHVLPTGFEILVVSSLLAHKFGAGYALVAISTIAGYSLFTFATTKWRTKFRKQMNAADNAAASHAVDALVNIDTVQYLGDPKQERIAYGKLLKEFEIASLKTAYSLALLNAGQSIIFSASLAAVMYMAAQDCLNGFLTLGDVVAVNGMIFQLSIPLNFLGTVYREFKQSITDMKQLFSLMHQKSLVSDGVELNCPKGHLKFENVNFSYPNHQLVLKNISFEVEPGQSVAFVGKSGCGKSTIVKLLFKLYDATSGQVLVDHQPLNNVSRQSILKHISIVPQDPKLFSKDVLYNLSYANQEASLEQLNEVAAIANIKPILQKKHSSMLSGGEKQRLSIARALLKPHKILVMDEGTSSLDSVTEQKVLNQMQTKLKREKITQIMIAHRLQTISHCDQIFVLENGAIIENGTHDELLSLNGSYKELWDIQN